MQLSSVVLPGAFGPMIRGTSPWSDREGHAGQRVDASEPLADLVHGEQAHALVSRRVWRKYCSESRLRPPKKSITPRGMKDDAHGEPTHPGRSANRQSSYRRRQRLDDQLERDGSGNRPSTVPAPPMTAIRIIWTLSR